MLRQHILSPVEKDILKDAIQISARYGNAPVVIIVGGVTGNKKLGRVMTASANTGGPDGKHGRLRHLLGLLQASIHIEGWKHTRKWK
jgi:hypothetical protein